MKLPYRSDIDGLRALAVIFVIVFHFFPKVFPKGFFGVDIFFVLSGFLIGEILLRELHSGTFSFKAFYARRAVRILPALLTVMIAAYQFGLGSLIAEKLKDLASQILAAGFFVINFFWIKEAGYFDSANEGKILLHLWSLAIEEQFYIIWPLALWISFKLRLNLLKILLWAIVISFYLCVIEPNEAVKYYSFHTRIWELLVGGLCAGVKCNYISIGENFQKCFTGLKKNINLLVLFALMLMVYGTGVGRFTDSYSIFDSLVAVVCAVVLLNSESTWFNKKILSHPVFVGIGLISYPLYLWHWPIKALHFQIRRLDSVTESITLVSLTFVLAVFTYYFIEKPIRSSKNRMKNSFVLAGGLFAFIVGAQITKINNGFPGRYSKELDVYAERVWNYEGDGVQDCRSIFKGMYDTICYGTEGPKIALFGDSHAAHFFQGFLKQDGGLRSIIAIGAGNCQPFSAAAQREGCDQAKQIALDYIVGSRSIETVLIGGYFGGYKFHLQPEEQIVNSLNATIDYLKNAGKKVVFILDVPVLLTSADLCYSPDLPLLKILREPPSFCLGSTHQERISQSKYRDFVARFKATRTDILFYDPYSRMCEGDVCKVINGGLILYSDNNHLSKNGAKFVVDDMIVKLKL